MTVGSAITCPRNVESEREITWSCRTASSPDSSRSCWMTPLTVARFNSTASTSSSARLLVRVKQAEPGVLSAPARSSGFCSKATEMSCTHCDPVGSSSRTRSRRSEGSIVDACLSVCLGDSGDHGDDRPHDHHDSEADHGDDGGHDGVGLESIGCRHFVVPGPDPEQRVIDV